MQSGGTEFVSRTVKILLGVSGASMLLATLAAMFIALQANRFLSDPVSAPDSGVIFVIKPGTAFTQVSNELADLGIIKHPVYFRWFARLSDLAGAVQAGEYLIEAGITPQQLLDKFVSGDVQLYSLTIVEGWTFRELLAALDASEFIANDLVYEDWPATLQSLSASASHPEGLFLPETYRFPQGTTGKDLLRQSFELMQTTLAAEWQNRDEGLPFTTPYEALILASIIEKETALAAERPRIAGVFVRRLEKGMRLQTDPTVIYGIGIDFNGNLTRRDLRSDTPYNTYTRGGLPPTPIALPGQAAINAALHPAAGTELYFVATALGDGSHKFSETKEQHDAAVKEYLVRFRAAQRSNRAQQ